MGTFDRIRVNDRVFQTKAFGKSMTTYHVGDTVRITPVAMSVDESVDSDLDVSGQVVQVEITPEDTVPELRPQRIVCVISNNVIVGVSPAPIPDVPMITKLGAWHVVDDCDAP